MKERRETEIEAAKSRLRRAIADASPGRIVEGHPFRVTGVALAVGLVLGFSRATRRTAALLTDMAVMTSGRAALRALALLGGRQRG